MRDHRVRAPVFVIKSGGGNGFRGDGDSEIRQHAWDNQLWLQEYRKNGISPGSGPL
jgi:hypothetical protein